MPDQELCPHCGKELPEETGPISPLALNGEVFEFDRLSYGERKQVKAFTRELVFRDDPEGDPETDWSQDDLRLAFAIVCSRRTTPDFTIEDGLKLTPAELEPAPPTKRVAKPRGVKAA